MVSPLNESPSANEETKVTYTDENVALQVKCDEAHQGVAVSTAEVVNANDANIEVEGEAARPEGDSNMSIPSVTANGVALLSNALESSAQTGNNKGTYARVTNADVMQAKFAIEVKPKNLKVVDHSYIDFSLINYEEFDDDTSLVGNPIEAVLSNPHPNSSLPNVTLPKEKKGREIRTFPIKLMEILNRSDVSRVIHWLPHGRSFLVRDPELLVSDVLPRFFKPVKYTSFTRQLQLWGFKRVSRAPDTGAYYHMLFLRGHPKLVKRMAVHKVKGVGKKLAPNPEGEPDFYALDEVRPLPQLQICDVPLPPLPNSSSDKSNVSQLQMSQPSQAQIAHANANMAHLQMMQAAHPMAGHINAQMMAMSGYNFMPGAPPGYVMQGFPSGPFPRAPGQDNSNMAGAVLLQNMATNAANESTNVSESGADGKSAAGGVAFFNMMTVPFQAVPGVAQPASQQQFGDENTSRQDQAIDVVGTNENEEAESAHKRPNDEVDQPQDAEAITENA